MKYDVTAKKSQVDGVEQQIMNGRPILMLGYDQSNSSGHAWVCDGFKHHGTNMNYFIEYRTPNSSTYTYSTCGESSPDMPYSHRVSGSTEYYMKWGWNGSGDGWYIASNVSVNGYNFSHNRKDLYITPKR